jgi:glutaredoxin
LLLTELNVAWCNVSVDAVIYTRSGCEDSEVMRDYLRSLGIESAMRVVDGDASARQEWEDFDGQVTPLLVIDQRRIVRGFDRGRIDQLVGWIGC